MPLDTPGVVGHLGEKFLIFGLYIEKVKTSLSPLLLPWTNFGTFNPYKRFKLTEMVNVCSQLIGTCWLLILKMLNNTNR